MRVNRFVTCARSRTAVAVFAAALFCISLAAATGTLFPTPLHLVREVEDPITHKVQRVEEYCAGNRIVTVNGQRVTITDYDQQQVTEIDHATATWSVTRFDEMAKAQARTSGPSLLAKTGSVAAPSWKTTPAGMKGSKAGRSVETFALENSGGQGPKRIEVGVDSRVMLSRPAVEVLIGAAYPGQHRPEHDEILVAAAGRGSGRIAAQSNGGSDALYALPIEQTVTIEQDGQTLVVRNSVVSIGNEAVPAEVMLIEPGAKRVESRLTRLAREIHDAETLPSRNPQP